VAAGIQIEIRYIRGPWLNVVVKGRQEGNVVSIVTTHHGPRFAVATHASEPKVLSGVWELPSKTEKPARGVKLVAVKLKVSPQDFESIDGLEGRWRFKLVIDKAGVGLFEVEGIAVVSDGNITRAENLVQLFYQEPVVLQVLLIPLIIGKGSDRYGALVRPAVGEA